GQEVDVSKQANDHVRDLGLFIREQRRTAEVSLRQLAKSAGVSNPYLSQIERGLRTPSAEILQQIARGLRISAEALYVRAGILEERPAGAVVDAILVSPDLRERPKQALLDVYRSFRQHAPAAPAPPPPAPGPGTAGPGPAGPLSSGPAGGEQARNPLLAALGAGDAAVAAVARAFADAFSAATATQRTVQQRVTDLPTELEGLRGRFPSEELR